MKITVKRILTTFFLLKAVSLFGNIHSFPETFQKNTGTVQNDSLSKSIEKIEHTFFNEDGSYKKESFKLNYDFAIKSFDTTFVEGVISKKLEVSFLRDTNGAFVFFRDFINGKPEKDYIVFAFNYR